mmetsp:Transcript_16743/g.34965  ORF Transcript_16743/g.34965 Transcript_16743/m.34965 type:complete len:238 (-) Transcript_16743:280-993(-)
MPELQGPPQQGLCPRLPSYCCQLLQLGPCDLQCSFKLCSYHQRQGPVCQWCGGTGFCSFHDWSWRSHHSHRMQAGRDSGRLWSTERCQCSQSRWPIIHGPPSLPRRWQSQLHGAVRAGLHAGCLVPGLSWSGNQRSCEGLLPKVDPGYRSPRWHFTGCMFNGHRCCCLCLWQNCHVPLSGHDSLHRGTQLAGTVCRRRECIGVISGSSRCFWGCILHRMQPGHQLGRHPTFANWCSN